MVEPIIRKAKHDKKLYKRCIKCRIWKLRQGNTETGDRAGFGKHLSASDGLQSICHTCKNVANKLAKNRNVTARLRHHIATRCLTQLGALAPSEFTANVEDYLGYKISALVKHLRTDIKAREGDTRKLRDALNEGYHIDHIKPLSLYKVIVDKRTPGDRSVSEKLEVDWAAFVDCWRIKNLSAIPASENLSKGAKYIEVV